MSTFGTQCTGYGLNDEIIVVVYVGNAFWGFIPNPQEIGKCNIMVDPYGNIMYFSSFHHLYFPVFYENRYMCASDVIHPFKELLFWIPGVFREELESNDPVGTIRFDDGQRIEFEEGMMPRTSISFAIIDVNRYVLPKGRIARGLLAGEIVPTIVVNTTTFNVVGNLVPITQVYLADSLIVQNHFYSDDITQDSPFMQQMRIVVNRMRPELAHLSNKDMFATLSIDNSETLCCITEKYFPELMETLQVHVTSRGAIIRFNAPLRNRDGKANVRVLGSAMYNI